MIVSFKCKETEKIFRNQFSKKFPLNVQKQAFKKMYRLDNAKDFSQVVEVDPKNFKFLKSDLHRFQVRVNDQYRIRFNIIDESITELELIDVQLKDFH